jgi:outer membrane biosynthesis protein TonB
VADGVQGCQAPVLEQRDAWPTKNCRRGAVPACAVAGDIGGKSVVEVGVDQDGRRARIFLQRSVRAHRPRLRR